MVEGPTARLYAIKIARSCRGQYIKKVYVKSLKRVYIPVSSLIGEKIEDTDTIGKNILLLTGRYCIRIHLMMYGSIHIYELNEDFKKPSKMIRLLIETDSKKIVVYNAPIVEIDYRDRLVGRLLKEYGPDPLRSDWDRNEAIRRILNNGWRKIGEVLLDQSVIAGIGNILRNEILFRAGIHPERLVSQLSRDEVKKIVDVAERLTREFLRIKLDGGRLKPILYVYNRYNEKCKICGSPIKFYIQKEVGRKTFVCEKCQR